MSEGESTATMTTPKITLGRVGRFIAFLLTSGYAYPHVCTEGMDLTKIQNEYETRKQD